MRVIAGSFKGLQLKGSSKLNIRPTKDRVKEALFNIIGHKIVGANFLDLFSGYGNIGIEAISRGANSVTFVDNNKLCVKIIKENLSILKQNNPEKNSVLCDDVINILKNIRKYKYRFDIIFMDPPYDTNLAEKSLFEVNRYDILNQAGWIVTEIPSRKNISKKINQLKQFRKEIYGNTEIVFYKI